MATLRMLPLKRLLCIFGCWMAPSLPQPATWLLLLLLLHHVLLLV
jgi:hypothetical protein